MRLAFSIRSHPCNVVWCLSAALVASLIGGTKLTKGPDLVANQRASDSIVTAALSPTKVLLCYRAVDTAYYMKCNAMSMPAPHRQASTGPGLLIYTSTSNITLARFSDSEALLCYQNVTNSMFGSCTVLRIDGLSLSKGPNLEVNSGKTGAISAASLSQSSSVMCYCGGDALTCRSLARAGLFLTRGADLMLNLVRPVEIALAPVSDTKVVICWRGASSASAGKCSVLNVVDSQKGPDVEVSSGSLQAQPWFASLAALTDKVVVACYQDLENGKASGKCNSLRVVGMSLHKGPSLVITDGSVVGSSGSADISVTRFSDVLAAACYRGGMFAYYTTCIGLNLFGQSLTKGPDLVIRDDGARLTSVSAFSDTSALVCYHPWSKKTVCNILTAEVKSAAALLTTFTTTRSIFAVVGRTSNSADRSCSLGFWARAFVIGALVFTSPRRRGGNGSLMT